MITSHLAWTGNNNKFYKEAWPIVSLDVIEAIQDFFRTGKLLKT